MVHNLDPPQTVIDLAESCVRFVDKAVGVGPDFTQDTLPLVDHYLALDENLSDQVLSLVVPACGAYFGEVLRRHLGGSWGGGAEDSGSKKGPESEYETWSLSFDTCSLTVLPVVIAYESAKSVMDGSTGFSVADADQEFAKAVLEEMGQVREADFATLAVRFEVIEQLYEKLSARTKERRDKN